MIFKIAEKVLKIESEELKYIVKDAVYIVIISILIGFIINIYHPKGYTFVTSTIQKNKNIVMISTKEAKIKFDNRAAIFLDSRQVDEYKTTHIPKALSVPAVPASISAKIIIKKFSTISRLKELVIYCDGESCGSSSILANRLLDMGYSRHIYILNNGIPDWEKKGFPVETNDQKSGSEDK